MAHDKTARRPRPAQPASFATEALRASAIARRVARPRENGRMFVSFQKYVEAIEDGRPATVPAHPHLKTRVRPS